MTPLDNIQNGKMMKKKKTLKNGGLLRNDLIDEFIVILVTKQTGAPEVHPC